MDRTKLRQWAFTTHWRACAVMAQNQVISNGSGSPEKDAATVGRDRALTTLPTGQRPTTTTTGGCGAQGEDKSLFSFPQGSLRGSGNPFRAGVALYIMPAMLDAMPRPLARGRRIDSSGGAHLW